MARPRYKALLFGDDYWATVVDEKMPYKRNGMLMKPYLIVPSEEMVEAYPEKLKKEDILDISTELGRGIWVEYPTSLIVDENPSRQNSIARVDCGFDGRETPHTKRRAKDIMMINDLQKENEDLKQSNISLAEEKRQLLVEVKSYLQDISEINQMMKGGTNERTDEDNPDIINQPR